MNKNKLKGALKTPLAIIIGTLLLPAAYAADINIPDDDIQLVTHNDGTTQTGNFYTGTQSGLELKLDQNSTWVGNIVSNALAGLGNSSSATLILQNNSTFNGNISGNIGIGVTATDSVLNGDLTSPYSTTIELTNSEYNGKITLQGSAQELSILNMDMDSASIWNGDIQASHSQLTTALYDASKHIGDVNGENSNYQIELLDGSQWQGDVTVTNSLDGWSSIHIINLNAGSQWKGNAVVTINTPNTGYNMAYQTLHVAENSYFEGNLEMHTPDSATEAESYTNIRVFDNSVWKGNSVFSGAATGIIYITEDSSWEGTLTHTGWNNYTADDSLPLQVNIESSQWTGHINTDKTLTNMMLYDGCWNITGSSKVDLLELYEQDRTNIIDFTANTNARDYSTLTVNDLEGNGHFIMRAGYFGQNDYGNDKLVILGDKNVSLLDASNHQMTVMNNGTNNTYGTEVLTMVTTVDGLDSFTLTNGEVELGGYVYTLEKVGTNWVLRPGAKGSTWEPEPEIPGTDGNGGGTPTITDPGKSAVNKVNVAYLLGYAETQTLYQRMGELRQSQSNGDVWARGYFGGFSQFSGGLLNGFKMNYNGVQIGTDAKIDVGNDALFLGMMFGLTHAKQDYATGKGTTRGKHIGLYSSYLTENDVYIDGVLKYSYFKDEMNVRDSQQQRVTGDSNSHSVSASVEAGKRFYFSAEKEGVYVEPQMQLAYARYSKAHMDLSNGLRVNIDGYDSLLGRAGVQLGYNVVESATPVNFYFKSSFVKEFDGKTDYTLNNSKQKHSFKGDWWTNGVGVSVQAMNNHQLYLDMEHSDGNRFNQHQINAGYRFSF